MAEGKTLDPAILDQFTGSETFYRFGLRRDALITEGVKYVADTAGAYWLLDAIVITNVYEQRVRKEEFQLWILTVGKGASGQLICDDGNGNVVYKQDLDYTDFPEPGIRLYFCNGTILLLSEY